MLDLNIELLPVWVEIYLVRCSRGTTHMLRLVHLDQVLLYL